MVAEDMQDARDPWLIGPADFAACRTPREQARVLVAHALLAPSDHNAQPWSFRRRGETGLELRADRSRALPVVDPADRALTMGCGGALANFRLAAAAFGVGQAVQPLPDRRDPDLLARLRLAGRVPAAPGGEALLRAMTVRRTNRFAFRPGAPPDAALRAATLAAGKEGVALVWTTEPRRRQSIATLVVQGDRAQMADPAFRRELAGWMRPPPAGARDGMAASAFGLSDLLGFSEGHALRGFALDADATELELALAAGSPALAVLATAGDGVADWLAAGQGLQRALLELTAAGLGHSFLSQPIEVAPLRPRLAGLIVPGLVPQALIRVGLAGQVVPPAARRPVEEVLADA
jgi:hypothetical protein